MRRGLTGHYAPLPSAAGEAEGHHKSTPPKRACGQVTNNPTLKEWHPQKTLFDELVSLADDAKVKAYDFPQFSVRVAYQGPVAIKLDPAAAPTEALPSTFEDSLAFENLELFKVIDGGKLVTRIKEIVTAHKRGQSQVLAQLHFPAW
jgi:hypothetical protein